MSPKNHSVTDRYQRYRTLHTLLCAGPPATPEFLDWFVGFCEGDGCFYAYLRKSTGCYEFSLEITQKDAQVLQYIQQTGGFGTVYGTKTNKYVLLIRKKQRLLLCVAVFAGNMRLYPRAARFARWAHLFLNQYVQQMEKKQLTQNPRKKRKPSLREETWFQALQLCQACEKQFSTTQRLDLETSWLSGFMQAEGCFSSEFRLSPSYSAGYQIMIRVRFRQNNVFQEFRQLNQVFGGYLRPKSDLKNAKQSYELVFSAEPMITRLVEYFTRFPLKGRKRRAQDRWIRAYALRAERRPLPPFGSLAYRRFVRFICSVNAFQHTP